MRLLSFTRDRQGAFSFYSLLTPEPNPNGGFGSEGERTPVRNEEWLEAHWAEVLPQARGKFLAIAGQEAFIADTPAEAWAWVDAVHPEIVPHNDLCSLTLLLHNAITGAESDTCRRTL